MRAAEPAEVVAAEAILNNVPTPVVPVSPKPRDYGFSETELSQANAATAEFGQGGPGSLTEEFGPPRKVALSGQDSAGRPYQGLIYRRKDGQSPADPARVYKDSPEDPKARNDELYN